jgi:hypothetical protein
MTITAINNAKNAMAAWQNKKTIGTFRNLMRYGFTHCNGLVDWIFTPWRLYRVVHNTVTGRYDV